MKGNTLQLQILQNIQNVEELRHTYVHIQFIVHASTHQQPTKITYPMPEGWKETNTSQELEAVIMQQQLQYFSQANDTPVIQEGSIYQFPHPQHPNAFLTSPVPDTSQGLNNFF